MSRLVHVSLSTDEIEAVREFLGREPHLRWAYLFGSAARGEEHRDLDLAVMPDTETGALGRVDLGRIAAAWLDSPP